MRRDGAVANGDVLAQTGRGRLEGDGVVVRVGYHVTHHYVVTSVEVKGVVVVVVAVVDGDALYLEAVACQIVLHPASRVAQGDAADGDVAALYEPEKVRTGDGLVVPCQLGESGSASVDGALSRDGHRAGLVGIDELDGRGVGAQRHIVGLYGDIVPDVCRAVEGGSVLEAQCDIALEEDAPGLPVSGRDKNLAPSGSVARVDGALDS